MSTIALIGIKSGMTAVFKETGEVIALTLLKVDKNVLLGKRTVKKDGYNALIIAGGGEKKDSRVNKPQLEVFKKGNIQSKKVIKEFRINVDIENISDQIVEFELVNEIKGSLIDVTAVSQGKGFQGVIKRHGFAGMPASHGVSVTHRHGGSTGQRELPGKTFKLRKMAGRMGNTKITIQNLRIFDVNADLGIIAIAGSIPGHNGTIVYIKDSIKSRSKSSNFIINGKDLKSSADKKMEDN